MHRIALPTGYSKCGVRGESASRGHQSITSMRHESGIGKRVGNMGGQVGNLESGAV